MAQDTYQDNEGLTAGRLCGWLEPALRSMFSMELPPDDGKGDGFLHLDTPFRFVSGEDVPIGLEVRNGQWHLSDHGDSWLRYGGLEDDGDARLFISTVVKDYGVSFDDKVVVMPLPLRDGADFASALRTAVQKFAACLIFMECQRNTDY